MAGSFGAFPLSFSSLPPPSPSSLPPANLPLLQYLFARVISLNKDAKSLLPLLSSLLHFTLRHASFPCNDFIFLFYLPKSSCCLGLHLAVCTPPPHLQSISPVRAGCPCLVFQSMPSNAKETDLSDFGSNRCASHSKQAALYFDCTVLACKLTIFATGNLSVLDLAKSID